MKTTERDDDVKRQRALGAVINSAILAAFVASLAVIGAQARDPQRLTLNCAYEPPRTGTASDAVSEIPGLCGTTAPLAAPPSARHGIPEAATVLDAGAPAEPQPPTF